MNINKICKNTSFALLFLGAGYFLDSIKKTPAPVPAPPSFISNVKTIYEGTNSIIAELDKDDLVDKINDAWNKKKMLVITISDNIVLKGDHFEIHPLNSNTCKEFITKIEDMLIIRTRLLNRTSGVKPILNGGEIINLTYRTFYEADSITKLQNGLTL